MEIEVKILPKVDSGASYPIPIPFVIAEEYITLYIDGREITFLITDFEKLVEIAAI